MKRIFTKLLIISIICAIITIICCNISDKCMDYKFFSVTQGVVNEVNEMGSDNPGSGWYLMFAGGTALFAELGIAVLYFVFVKVIPTFMLILIMVSQIIARLFQIGSEKKWKNTTSKVFTYISTVLQILLCLELIYIISILKNVLLLIALIPSIVCAVLFVKELIGMGKNKVDIVESV